LALFASVCQKEFCLTGLRRCSVFPWLTSTIRQPSYECSVLSDRYCVYAVYITILTRWHYWYGIGLWIYLYAPFCTSGQKPKSGYILAGAGFHPVL